MKKVDVSIITKIAKRVMESSSLYDEELEKRIIKAIKEKKSKVYQIKRITNPIDLL